MNLLTDKNYELRKVINFFKATTFLYVGTLMFLYDNYSTTSYVYLSLHGTYGWMWLLKDKIFPDKNFEEKINLPVLMFSSLFLTMYWVSPYLIISNYVYASNLKICFCIMLHTIGLVTMMCSDTQKYFVLKEKKKLINDGWFKKSRNTNYLGEMILYFSYALLGTSYIPFCILFMVWFGIFYSSMLLKDKSLKQKEGGLEYIKNSSLLIPI